MRGSVRDNNFFIKNKFLYICIFIIIISLSFFMFSNENSKKKSFIRKLNLSNPQQGWIKTIPNNTNEGNLKWNYYIPGSDLLDPAIGIDNTIYFGTTTSGLHAFTPQGELKWHLKRGGCGSICVALDGTIYLSTGLGICANYPNGEYEGAKWCFAAGGSVYTMGAVGNDGTLYFGCDDRNMYSVSPFGELNWKFPTKGKINSSPAIGPEGMLYFGSEDGYIYALYPDGVLKWRFNTFDSIGCPVYMFVWGNPAIGKDGTIYISSWKNCYAFSPDGNLKWKLEYRYKGICSLAIGFDGTLYLRKSYSTALLALNQENGLIEWSFNPWGGGWGGVLSIGSDKIIYSGIGIPDSSTSLCGLTPNGTIKYEFTFGGARGVSCPAIADDGTIYVGTVDSGTIYLYALNSPSHGLANSSWPKWKHDNMNTSNFNLTLLRPFPPQCFAVVKKENRSLLAYEYINILTWESNQIEERDTEKYRIYQIDKQSRTILVELDKKILEYFHRGVEKNKKYYYAIAAVDYSGQEGSLSYCKVD